MQVINELEQLYADKYLSILSRTEKVYPATLLVFSGIPGSGKTTLARQLAKDFNAHYIQHDLIRQMVKEAGNSLEEVSVPHISRHIINIIMEKDDNKFIILDSSIDRSWSIFFKHVQEERIHPIIIRMNIPYEYARERLIKRDGSTSNLAKNLDVFIKQFENCIQHVQADFELNESLDYSALKLSIKQIIE